MQQPTIRVSVIMPVDRPGEDANRAVRAVLDQKTSAPFELIVVGSLSASLPRDPRLRHVAMEDRNPAIRRNAAALEARGEILAFIDDDAFAAPDWIEKALGYLDAHPQVVAVGGPDPPPDDSPRAELLSDTLLATRWFGSGVAAHESREGVFPIRKPWDVALVNLFVRRAAFDVAGGFDRSIGYIGEDTDLVRRLFDHGKVVYHHGLCVFHRRRRFPREYLRQRWRYRVKTGERLLRRGSAYRSVPLFAFLAAGAILLALLLLVPGTAPSLLLLYAAVVTACAIPSTRLPASWWPLIPIAFAMHHATYFAGIVTGIVKGMFTKAPPTEGGIRRRGM
jgi:glycosyltransferase involved in cell wall biosynthesis